MSRIFIASLGLVWATCFAPMPAHASVLSFVSDLISTSQPSVNASHSLSFTTINAIPAGGSITISSEEAFVLPIGFGFTDIDVSVSSGGPFVERDLAETSSATEDGIAIVPGSNGTITITLNSSTGIGAGDVVRVELGSTAIYPVPAVLSPTNPATVASYRIRIVTRDVADALIDYGTAMIAIVLPVTLTTNIIAVPPLRLNAFPNGTIAAGNPVIELSLGTDKIATCRFSTTPGVEYTAMTNQFTSIGGQLFLHITTGNQDGQTYNYYVRCADVYGTANPDDLLISYTLEPTPLTNTSINPDGTTGTSGTGGTLVVGGTGGIGQIPNGSGVLYKASVTLSGWAMPQSTVYFLKDGVQVATVPAATDGTFASTVTGLERGTYSFMLYAIDTAGVRSAPFSSTITVTSGSRNSIASIVIPPSIRLEKNSVSLTEPVKVLGESIPGGTVDVYVNPRGLSDLGSTKKYTTTANAGAPGTQVGAWEVTFNADEFTRGTHDIKAKTSLGTGGFSDFSKTVSLGIGEAPAPDYSNRADINRDGKVNLVDFSILLSYWKTDDADADINQDGDVSLADFSILLFNWTG